jgi:hypothetical protein
MHWSQRTLCGGTGTMKRTKHSVIITTCIQHVQTFQHLLLRLAIAFTYLKGPPWITSFLAVSVKLSLHSSVIKIAVLEMGSELDERPDINGYPACLPRYVYRSV